MTVALDPTSSALAQASIAACRGDRSGVEHALHTGRRAGVGRDQFEEAFLQGALYFGFPRALTAFQTLNAVWESEAPAAETDRSAESADFRHKGLEVFRRIYSDKSETVREMLLSLHPDLESFVIECAYGRVLARTGLSLVHREVCATAVLAVLEQEPQLVGHARAALALGLTSEQLQEVLDLAVDDPRLRAGYRSRIDPGS